MSKFKKSVTATLAVATLGIFGAVVIINGGEPNVGATKVEEVKEVKEVDTSLTFLERQEVNEGIAVLAEKENSDKHEAFLLTRNSEHHIFMDRDNKNVIHVDNSVVAESYVTNLVTGDNVTLYGEGDNIKAVGLEAGKAVDMIVLELDDYSDDYVSMTYVDERGNFYELDKKDVERYNMRGATIGSVATGYIFDGELVAINRGW